MIIRNVKSGDRLSISADVWNKMQDMLREWLGNEIGSKGDLLAKEPDVVWIKNDTGENLDRFAVLGISGTVFTPGENADEFSNRPIFTGVTPATASHVGKFVITLSPVPIGGLVKAVVSGITVCSINVSDAGHTWADVKDGDRTQLQSDTSGSAQILYKESGTGTKKAIVRFGNDLASSIFSFLIGVNSCVNDTSDSSGNPVDGTTFEQVSKLRLGDDADCCSTDGEATKPGWTNYHLGVSGDVHTVRGEVWTFRNTYPAIGSAGTHTTHPVTAQRFVDTDTIKWCITEEDDPNTPCGKRNVISAIALGTDPEGSCSSGDSSDDSSSSAAASCRCNGVGAYNTGVVGELAGTPLFSGTFSCNVGTSKITFDGSTSDDIAVLLPVGSTITKVVAGGVTTYTLPANCIIFRDNAGWLQGINGQVDIVQGGNTYTLPNDPTDPAPPAQQHHVIEMEANGFTTYPWSHQFTQAELIAKGLLTGPKGTLSFKWALIITGNGQLNTPGATCV